jgi:hypothetical protein
VGRSRECLFHKTNKRTTDNKQGRSLSKPKRFLAIKHAPVGLAMGDCPLVERGGAVTVTSRNAMVVVEECRDESSKGAMMMMQTLRLTCESVGDGVGGGGW